MPRIASPITRKVATLHSRWLGDIDDHVIGLAWSPDGTILAAAAIAGPSWLFDGGSGKVQRAVPGHHFGTGDNPAGQRRERRQDPSLGDE